MCASIRYWCWSGSSLAAVRSSRALRRAHHHRGVGDQAARFDVRIDPLLVLERD
jgi:hypothetical protein